MAHLPGTLRDGRRRDLEKERLSLWEHCEGNLEGGFFTRDFERRKKEGSGNGTPLSMGALRGEPGGRLLSWGD